MSLTVSTALEAALQLASAGIPVYPVWSITDGECDCGKPDCQHPGKHPLGRTGFAPNGVRSATTDPDTIRSWFDRVPSLNIAVATGHKLPSGRYLAVLDVDPRHRGDRVLADLEAQHEALPRTVSVKTGGDGLHVYLSTPEPIPNTELAPGLEIKGVGGSVVAPPSLHTSGQRYTWTEPFDPTVLALVPPPIAPEWLLDLVTTMRRERERAEIGSGAIPEGTRNTTLASYAGALRRAGASQDLIEAALSGVNECCDVPLDRREVRQIAKSVSRYEPAAATAADQRVEIVSPSLDRVKPIHWAWRDWLAMGMLNLLVGDEGAGKGTLASYVLAQLTRGKLDGDLGGQPAMVLVLGEEDDFDRIWTPRLHVAGADLEYIRHVRGEHGETLSFPSGIAELRRVVEETKARVVFFDQLLDNIDVGVDDWRSRQVRTALRPLHALAGELNFTAIGALHTNKAKGGSFRQSVSGTHAFNALSRSSLLVGQHPEGPEERRVVARGKGNYAQRPVSREFTIQGRSPRIGDHVIQTSVAVDFKDSPLTADDLLAPPKREPTSKAARAREYIATVLADGESHDAGPIVEYLATEFGIHERAARKAREDVGAISESRPEFQGGATWRLPRPHELFSRNDRFSRDGDISYESEAAKP